MVLPLSGLILKRGFVSLHFHHKAGQGRPIKEGVSLCAFNCNADSARGGGGYGQAQ